MGDKCEWQQDENGVWETNCGNLFEVTEGTPYENDLKYCPYCGKHLVQGVDEDQLVDRMRHAACHCEGQFDAEWEALQLRDGADEIERLRKILQQILVDAQAQNVLFEWWTAIELALTPNDKLRGRAL